MTTILTEFRQESNSLSPFTSDLEYWRSGWVLTPDQARDFLPTQDCAVTGMQQVMESAGRGIVFGPAYYSQSGGPAEQVVMDSYLESLLPVVEATPNLEAIFFSFHGALQTTEYDDAEAEVARRVRRIVGDDVFLAASTDSHGYVSRELMNELDAIAGYHTYPHIDFMETGRRVARLGIKSLEDRSGVATAWVPIPMMVSASGYDTLQGPYRDLIDYGKSLVADNVILDFSVYQMQPWLDVPAPNSAVVVSAGTQDAARTYAEELSLRLYQHRSDFDVDLADIDNVLARVVAGETHRPTIIVDSADSPNAGAAGDSVFVPRAALATDLPSGSTLSLLSVVVDSPAVAAAFDAGVGGNLELELGGTLDAAAPSTRVNCYVVSLHDGHFRNEHVGSAGTHSFLGRTAVIRMKSNEVTVTMVVCEQLVSPGDPQLYRGMGLEPTHFDAVVVKANTSFKAAYSDFAGDVIMTDTPGAATANIANAPFVRLPQTIYPWVDAPFTPTAEFLRG